MPKKINMIINAVFLFLLSVLVAKGCGQEYWLYAILTEQGF